MAIVGEMVITTVSAKCVVLALVLAQVEILRFSAEGPTVEQSGGLEL